MSKKRSPAWEKARAERRARRQRLPEQARDEQGYIIKTVDGRVVKYDPGEEDRELYLEQRKERKNRSWEAPIG